MIDWNVALAVATLALSTGVASLLVNAVRGLWVRAQQRVPRVRVKAIKTAAETLALLEEESPAHRAVSAQMASEALALGFSRSSDARALVVHQALASVGVDAYIANLDQQVAEARRRGVTRRIASLSAGILAVGAFLGNVVNAGVEIYSGIPVLTVLIHAAPGAVASSLLFAVAQSYAASARSAKSRATVLAEDLSLLRDW